MVFIYFQFVFINLIYSLVILMPLNSVLIQKGYAFPMEDAQGMTVL